MKLLLRVIAGLFGCLILAILATAGWFFFYSGDLSEIGYVNQSVPARVQTVSDACVPRTLAVPYSQIGEHLRDAILSDFGEGRVGLRMQLARSVTCQTRGQQLERQIHELRLANLIGRRFTPEQVLTAFANRAYFGQELYGAESASLHYFEKHANELSLPEAALLATLIEGPKANSPESHPERAFERRNAVLDRMAIYGMISRDEAERAKLVRYNHSSSHGFEAKQ